MPDIGALVAHIIAVLIAAVLVPQDMAGLAFRRRRRRHRRRSACLSGPAGRSSRARACFTRHFRSLRWLAPRSMNPRDFSQRCSCCCRRRDGYRGLCLRPDDRRTEALAARFRRTKPGRGCSAASPPQPWRPSFCDFHRHRRGALACKPRSCHRIGGAVAEIWRNSALKRHFSLKDSGDLIPGHGGFMDRMDGIVTASIAGGPDRLCD